MGVDLPGTRPAHPIVQARRTPVYIPHQYSVLEPQSPPAVRRPLRPVAGLPSPPRVDLPPCSGPHRQALCMPSAPIPTKPRSAARPPVPSHPVDPTHPPPPRPAPVAAPKQHDPLRYPTAAGLSYRMISTVLLHSRQPIVAFSPTLGPYGGHARWPSHPHDTNGFVTVTP